MARFDIPLPLMLNAEGVQTTGDGTIVKDIFTENEQWSKLIKHQHDLKKKDLQQREKEESWEKTRKDNASPYNK